MKNPKHVLRSVEDRFLQGDKTQIFQHFSKLGAFRRVGNVVANQKMCVHNSPFESNTTIAFAFYDSSCKFIDLPLKSIL